MRRADSGLYNSVKAKLTSFRDTMPLPGIDQEENLNCFAEQIVDSARRIKYISILNNKIISDLCKNPYNNCFDPLKAVIVNKREGNFNEAIWLTFLLTHFGKNKATSWNLLKAFYQGKAEDSLWTWQNVISQTDELMDWLSDNNEMLRYAGNFSNHRKYIGKDAPRHTGETILSFIDVFANSHDLASYFNNAQVNVHSNTKYNLFDYLFKIFRRGVRGFGRMGVFDFLTMIGKFELVDIEPGHTYLKDATGPLLGAKLLFIGDKNVNISATQLENEMTQLGEHLDLHFGMQVLEDAICNWQKNPSQFVHFTG